MLSRPRTGGVINVAANPTVISKAGERVNVTLTSTRPILGFLVTTVLPDGTKVGKWDTSPTIRVPAMCPDQVNTDTITHNDKLPWETFSVSLTYVAPLDALDGESYTIRVITLHGTEEDTIQLTGEFANNTLVVTTKLVDSPGPPARTVPRNSTAPSPASTNTVLSALSAFALATACLLLA